MRRLIPIPLVPEPRERESRRCCNVSLLLFLMPLADFVWFISGSVPRWLVHKKWVLIAPWVAASAIGLLYAIRACRQIRCTRDGLPLLALIVHVASLLFLGLLAYWGESVG
jgi:hypothetical protein